MFLDFPVWPLQKTFSSLFFFCFPWISNLNLMFEPEVVFIARIFVTLFTCMLFPLFWKYVSLHLWTVSWLSYIRNWFLIGPKHDTSFSLLTASKIRVFQKATSSPLLSFVLLYKWIAASSITLHLTSMEFFVVGRYIQKGRF